VNDFKAQEADAVLGCGDLKATARIEDGNDDRLKVLLNGLRESSIENLAGDGQGHSSQRGFFQCSFWSDRSAAKLDAGGRALCRSKRPKRNDNQRRHTAAAF
jgi:hypothetical protein